MVAAKDSFSVNGKGQVMVGPLFLMTKMEAGFNAGSGDWQYQMVMPNGTVFGTTNGAGSAKVQFCADCHNAVGEQDALWFLPEEYRRVGGDGYAIASFSFSLDVAHSGHEHAQQNHDRPGRRGRRHRARGRR